MNIYYTISCILAASVFGALALMSITPLPKKARIKNPSLWAAPKEELIPNSTKDAEIEPIPNAPESQHPVWKFTHKTSFVMPTKFFTAEDWENLTENDEVNRFVERVNAAAFAKDYWKDDFRRALYDAFHEEYGKLMVEKYNNGEGFCVKGGTDTPPPAK